MVPINAVFYRKTFLKNGCTVTYYICGVASRGHRTQQPICGNGARGSMPACVTFYSKMKRLFPPTPKHTPPKENKHVQVYFIKSAQNLCKYIVTAAVILHTSRKCFETLCKCVSDVYTTVHSKDYSMCSRRQGKHKRSPANSGGMSPQPCPSHGQ